MVCNNLRNIWQLGDDSGHGTTVKWQDSGCKHLKSIVLIHISNFTHKKRVFIIIMSCNLPKLMHLTLSRGLNAFKIAWFNVNSWMNAILYFIEIPIDLLSWITKSLFCCPYFLIIKINSNTGYISYFYKFVYIRFIWFLQQIMTNENKHNYIQLNIKVLILEWDFWFCINVSFFGKYMFGFVSY